MTKRKRSKKQAVKSSTPGVGIYVDQIELTNARIFRREPYILALVATETAGREATRFQTEPTKGITAKHPWTPEPPIELLSPVVDPGSHAVAQVVVMESDRGYRRAGERLGDFRDAMSGTRLGKVVLDAAGIASSGLAVSLVSEATGMAVGLLRSAGDDHLGVATLSVPRNADGSWPVGRYTVETEKCRVTFRVAGGADEEVDDEPVVIQGALSRSPVDELSSPDRAATGGDEPETMVHLEEEGSIDLSGGDAQADTKSDEDEDPGADDSPKTDL